MRLSLWKIIFDRIWHFPSLAKPEIDSHYTSSDEMLLQLLHRRKPLLKNSAQMPFLLFLLPPPAEILAQRSKYQLKLRSRLYMAPEGVFEDSSTYALYRIYEYLVVDHVIGYRNQMEYFWRQRSWAVSDIPDPEDPDPARYAFLACTTQLLVKAFNNLIKQGLPRKARAILLPEELEEFKAQPESQREYERIPLWAEKVPPLRETLVMVSHDDVILDGLDDERADVVFKEKNILFWGPHIYFT